MADTKISALPQLTAGGLDLVNDHMLVVDVSTGDTKRMAPGEFIRAAVPFLSSTYDFTPNVLPVGVSFGRATTGWVEGDAGLVVAAAPDVPRFAGGDLGPGLLIEGAATNDLLMANDFDNAYWGKPGTTIGANAAVAPDGTMAMDAIRETAVYDYHYLSRAYAFVAGTTYPLSFYAKANGQSWFYLDLVSAAFGTLQRTFFDLANGVVGTKGSNTTAFIRHVGGGIYRCAVLATATASVTANVQCGISTDGVITQYTGDGTKGVLLWGGMLAPGSCLTSPIPTTSSAVTRAADFPLITNPQARADQCWILKFRVPRRIAGGPARVIAQADIGSEGSRRRVEYGSDGKLRVIATLGGAGQCDLDMGTATPGAAVAMSVRWGNSIFAASRDGGLPVTLGSGVNPLGMAAMRLGHSSVGEHLNSALQFFATRPPPLDAELPLLAA